MKLRVKIWTINVLIESNKKLPDYFHCVVFVGSLAADLSYYTILSTAELLSQFILRQSYVFRSRLIFMIARAQHFLFSFLAIIELLLKIGGGKNSFWKSFLRAALHFLSLSIHSEPVRNRGHSRAAGTFYKLLFCRLFYFSPKKRIFETLWNLH